MGLHTHFWNTSQKYQHHKTSFLSNQKKARTLFAASNCTIKPMLFSPRLALVTDPMRGKLNWMQQTIQHQGTSINRDAFGQWQKQQQQRLTLNYYNVIICGIYPPVVYLPQIHVHVDFHPHIYLTQLLYMSISATALFYTPNELSIYYNLYTISQNKQKIQPCKITGNKKKSLLLIPTTSYLHLFFLSLPLFFLISKATITVLSVIYIVDYQLHS